MATPGELVKVIAATTGEDEATVTQHDRNLVVAGLRSKGGRGPSAAKVTPRDAAHILTAILGSPRVKDSVYTVRRYMQTQEHRAHWHQHYPDDVRGIGSANVWENYGIRELAELPPDHTFIDAFTLLLTLAAEGRLVRELGDFYALDSIKILLTSPSTHARISMSYIHSKGDYKSVQADYGSNESPPEWTKDKRQPTEDEIRAYSAPQPPRLRRSTEMNALPIIYVGALLAGKLDQLPKLGEGLKP
jgi:hypothetical protein